MCQRGYYFLVVLFFVFNSTTYSQENIPRFYTQLPNSVLSNNSCNDLKVKTKNSNCYSIYSSLSSPPKPLYAGFYISQLGFFCKKEIAVEKYLTIPLRFRLGSLEYVNFMEQKPNAGKSRF